MLKAMRSLVVFGLAMVAMLGVFSRPVAAQDQYILRSPVPLAQGVADRHGLTLASQIPGQDIFLVTVPTGRNPDDLIAEVEADTDVVGFERNGRVFIPEALQGSPLNQSTASILDAMNNRTLVTYFGRQVWASYVSQPSMLIVRLAESQKNYGLTGAAIVAVIDTGIDYKHPVLSASLVSGFDFTRNVAGLASDWTDLNQSTASILDQSTASILDSTNAPVILNQSTASILDQSTASILDTTQVPKSFGHGTMVAGIIHVIAPGARLMPLKAFNADGSSDVYNILRAIYYATQNGARVINMSFSLAGFSNEFARAVSFAEESGVTCVASAGNSGSEVLVYPAALRNVISVASTDNLDARSTFSNYGPALVFMAAPGEGIITTYPGQHYAGAWGTSFSSPMVAGAAALLLQIDPKMSPDKIAGGLGHGAKVGQDLGSGRLDLVQAISSRSK